MCRQYKTGPIIENITIPVLSKSLHRDALLKSHDTPMAGHQGMEKTLDHLKHIGYWASMSHDVKQHCKNA